MEQEEKEQIKVENHGRAMSDLVHSESWAIARKMLTDMIVELQWIGNIEGATAEERDADAKSKQKAVDILFAWLQDIEGDASQFANNADLINNVKSDIYERKIKV